MSAFDRLIEQVREFHQGTQGLLDNTERERNSACAELCYLKMEHEQLRSRLAAAEAVCIAADRLDDRLAEFGTENAHACAESAQAMHDALDAWRKLNDGSGGGCE